MVKKPTAKADINSAIQTAHSEQQSLAAQRDALAEQIQGLEREKQHVQSTLTEHSQSKALLKTALESIQGDIRTQEAYCALWDNASGTQELTDLLGTQSTLLEQLHHVVQECETFTTRLTEIDAALVESRMQRSDLERRIATIGNARERLVQENSATVYAECSRLFEQAVQTEVELRDVLSHASDETQMVRGASIQRLSQWPEVRRRFEAEHQLNDDSTVQALESFIAMLDILLKLGRSAGEAIAGMPASCSDLFLELELDTVTLRALSTDNRHPLQQKRERIFSLLQAYRQNLARL